MTPNDILTLAMVLTEPLVKTEKHGNIATYSLKPNAIQIYAICINPTTTRYFER